MQLFIDSSDPKEILQAREWGIIDGVTSNPALISKGGPDMQATLSRILDASPGQVFCQAVGSKERDPLVAQARWLHNFSDRIIVKLPMSIAGIQALIQLKSESPEIKLAVTTVCSIAQAYLVGKHGADVVALFNGPLDQVIDQPVDIVAPVKKIYENYGFKTKVLSCGRLPRAFGEFAVAGTDICTMKLEFLKLLFDHPFTEKRIAGFAQDWKGAFGDQTWPELTLEKVPAGVGR
ncbi:MAG: transaldolase family protein [Armatimonadota bacterium]